MKLYNREDFLKLPALTIYSRMPGEMDGNVLLLGLYCKVSDSEYVRDWVEQDLLSESGCDSLSMGTPADPLVLRDEYKDFRTDLDCAGRDGMFDPEDKFVVWDREDIGKLMQYLDKCYKSAAE